MKLLFFLSFLLALVWAHEENDITRSLFERQTRRRQPVQAARPEQVNAVGARIQSARRPANVPSEYTTGVDSPTVQRNTNALQRVPSGFSKMRMMARQGSADFYECPNTPPNPTLSDCMVVTDAVYDTNQELVVTRNGCLVFTYRSCKGFFCSLCSDVRTSTNFIANQLLSVESLCVNSGFDGVIVAERPPQWDAGFVHANEGLPFYNVC